MFRIFGHWLIPLACAIVWWGMLIAMLSVWSAQGKPKYGTDRKGVVLVYISDIGAWSLQALFIACASVQGAFFVLALTAERYLRHAGRLPKNMQRREKVSSGLAIFFSIPGQIGIILVAVFDTVNHHNVHFSMLILFLVATGLSAFFTILEFGFLDKAYSNVTRLRVSCVFKAVWLVIAIILAICFAAFNRSDRDTVAAVFEWFLAFFYGFYVLILAYDLYPVQPRSAALDAEAQLDRSSSRFTGWWLSRRISQSALAHPPSVQEKDDAASLHRSSSNSDAPSSEENGAARLGDLVYENRLSMVKNKSSPQDDDGPYDEFTATDATPVHGYSASTATT